MGKSRANLDTNHQSESIRFPDDQMYLMSAAMHIRLLGTPGL